MDEIECVVAGAGAVGLAIARELARDGREVVVIEAEGGIGRGVSSRSSEVIHAGLYYATGLAKTRLCVRGRDLLYTFCAEHHVPHKRIGKLLVATSEAELPRLEAIHRQAMTNGVDDMRPLTAREAREFEPELSCVAAFLSPSTGIIDSHAYMLALQGEAEAHGAMVCVNTPIIASEATTDGILIETGGDAPFTVKARHFINAAGLGAQALAGDMRGMPRACIPPLHLAKGNYCALNHKPPFSHLIYPMPSDGGLGVHLTLDLAGQVRFGPDVEWIDDLDYAVSPDRADAFYSAIRRYWPGLRDGELVPDYAGIRPKIARPGGSDTDFLIQTEEAHGLPGVVHLFGIESPGLTASLAIAEEVAGRLER